MSRCLQNNTMQYTVAQEIITCATSATSRGLLDFPQKANANLKTEWDLTKCQIHIQLLYNVQEASYLLTKIKHINDKIGLKINVITNISIHSFLATVDVKRIACRVLGSTKKKLCWYSIGHCGQQNPHFEPCRPSIPCQAITTQAHVAKLKFFYFKIW